VKAHFEAKIAPYSEELEEAGKTAGNAELQSNPLLNTPVKIINKLRKQVLEG